MYVYVSMFVSVDEPIMVVYHLSAYFYFFRTMLCKECGKSVAEGEFCTKCFQGRLRICIFRNFQLKKKPSVFLYFDIY